VAIASRVTSSCWPSAIERPQEGNVVAVAPGQLLDSGRRVQPEVKPGDEVLFAKYAGTEVKLDDEEYLVLRENELLAVVANGTHS
jgi:chaperonin GroES